LSHPSKQLSPGDYPPTTRRLGENKLSQLLETTP
jgi:hypothetical protein